MSKNSDRHEYMNGAQRAAMDAKGYTDKEGKFHRAPRTHQTCIEATGVARPGKTAQDRSRRGHRGA